MQGGQVAVLPEGCGQLFLASNMSVHVAPTTAPVPPAPVAPVAQVVDTSAAPPAVKSAPTSPVETTAPVTSDSVVTEL